MQILATDGPNGSKVTPNATKLTQALLIGETDIHLENGDIFPSGTVLMVEEEDVETSGTGVNPTVSRAQNSTSEDNHTIEGDVWVLKKAGEVILEHTFEAGQWTEGIWISTGRKFWYALEVDGTRSAPENVLDEPKVFIPSTRHQPDVNQNVKIIVWCTETQMFQTRIV